jgi:hypothetical protein
MSANFLKKDAPVSHASLVRCFVDATARGGIHTHGDAGGGGGMRKDSFSSHSFTIIEQ